MSNLAGLECVCPLCKFSVKHFRNTTCMEIKCPRCGARMKKQRKIELGKIGEVDVI